MTQVIATPKGNITIRQATPQDAEALFQLRLEALSRHPESFASDMDKTTAEGVEPWQKQISGQSTTHTGVICVATSENNLIGMSGVERGHSLKTRHSAYIWGVYVNADWRGMHIAGAILNELCQWAHENGVVVVKLGVITSNEPAIHCYLHNGFEVYGSEPKVLFVNGVYYDELQMARST